MDRTLKLSTRRHHSRGLHTSPSQAIHRSPRADALEASGSLRSLCLACVRRNIGCLSPSTRSETLAIAAYQCGSQSTGADLCVGPRGSRVDCSTSRITHKVVHLRMRLLRTFIISPQQTRAAMVKTAEQYIRAIPHPDEVEINCNLR